MTNKPVAYSHVQVSTHQKSMTDICFAVSHKAVHYRFYICIFLLCHFHTTVAVILNTVSLKMSLLLLALLKHELGTAPHWAPTVPCVEVRWACKPKLRDSCPSKSAGLTASWVSLMGYGMAWPPPWG